MSRSGGADLSARLTDALAWDAARKGIPLALPDLTDPGTAHAVLVALALALGLDPGLGGLGVVWQRLTASPGWSMAPDASWCLQGLRSTPDAEMATYAILFVSNQARAGQPAHHRLAPEVATEPDPIKALILAVRHVLNSPGT